MFKRLIGVVVGFGLLLGLTACPRATTTWTRQFGSSADDNGFGVAVDGSGNAYITGWTLGSLNGSNAGGADVFLAKYDRDGNQQWIRQLGSNGHDTGLGVAVDGNGNAYIAGETRGSLNGSNAGGDDVFLAKYDSSGTQQWIRQLGSSKNDTFPGVAVDAKGNTYITGTTAGSLNGSNAGEDDVFLAKYDTKGNQQWTRQLGSSDYDGGRGVAVDGKGNAYITGIAGGDLNGSNAGLMGMFLVKYDSNGNQQWTRQLDGSDDDYAVGLGVAVDNKGNAYISGWAASSRYGSNAGGMDVLFVKYDSNGSQQWIHQLGTSEDDNGYGVAVDGKGNAYISGTTAGSLYGSNAGGADVFLAKFNSKGNQQ